MNRTKHNPALWLTAAAAVAASPIPASAEVYLTESQALGVVLGDRAVVRREQKAIDPALRKRLEEASGLRFPETSLTFFIAAQDAKPVKYAVAMNELGKSEPITFMVGMSPEGKVTEVVIMEFRENRGWEVKEKRFLNQFRGKSAKNSIRVDEDIINYTGATLSSKAVARGVKRALLLLDALYPGEARYKLSAAKDFAMPSELQPDTVIGTRTGYLGLYRQARYAMGTQCEIKVWCFTAGEARSLFEKGFGELERIEQVFSAYREDSELSRVNGAAAEGYIHVGREFFALTHEAVKAANETDGAINFAIAPLADLWKRCETEQRWPTRGELVAAKMLSRAERVELDPATDSLRFRVCGTKLDFGGIAKGYAAEKIGNLLEEAGATSALVNLGRSSIYATSVDNECAVSKENNEIRIDEWPLAILKPGTTNEIAEILLLEPGEAVSTSGTTERGFVICGERLSHIIDSTTGFPVQGIRSATVSGRGGIATEIASKDLLLALNNDAVSSKLSALFSYWTRIERA